MDQLNKIASQFLLQGRISQISPLGNGLINDTYLILTQENAPDYVLQRINNNIFHNVELLQHNIEVVTTHIHRKLEAAGEDDLERKVLTFIPTLQGKTYYQDSDGSYWRISVFIPRSKTLNVVMPASSYDAGKAFGRFEAMLTDLHEPLGETIPDFHNMELRIRQLREAVATDAVGRVSEVEDELAFISNYTDEMCQAERLYREGKLPKRICHCDTKVNNMLFDEQGQVLCVIDLDTVMPSFVFSDFGDFLRTAANTVAEDCPDLEKIQFRDDVFEAFSRGYLESARSFLTPLELQLLPFAVGLFPMMQAVRFLTDYLNGDTYYKTAYPLHNLVRTRNQLQLFRCIKEREEWIHSVLSSTV